MIQEWTYYYVTCNVCGSSVPADHLSFAYIPINYRTREAAIKWWIDNGGTSNFDEQEERCQKCASQ